MPRRTATRLRKERRRSGGTLFGCWRSVVGLGLARDEGIALSAWPDEACGASGANRCRRRTGLLDGHIATDR